MAHTSESLNDNDENNAKVCRASYSRVPSVAHNKRDRCLPCAHLPPTVYVWSRPRNLLRCSACLMENRVGKVFGEHSAAVPCVILFIRLGPVTLTTRLLINTDLLCRAPIARRAARVLLRVVASSSSPVRKLVHGLLRTHTIVSRACNTPSVTGTGDWRPAYYSYPKILTFNTLRYKNKIDLRTFRDLYVFVYHVTGVISMIYFRFR